MGTRSRRDRVTVGSVLEPAESGDDYELLWKQNLTDAVRDLVSAVADLRSFMAGALEHRASTDERLKRLENAGVGIRGWLVIVIATLSFLATASCGGLQLIWMVYQFLGK